MKNDISAEKTLNVIANTILVVGSISSLIVFFYITAEYENILGLIYAILILFSSVAIWATYRVFINISLLLREILNPTIDKQEMSELKKTDCMETETYRQSRNSVLSSNSENQEIN